VSILRQEVECEQQLESWERSPAKEADIVVFVLPAKHHKAQGDAVLAVEPATSSLLVYDPFRRIDTPDLREMTPRLCAFFNKSTCWSWRNVATHRQHTEPARTMRVLMAVDQIAMGYIPFDEIPPSGEDAATRDVAHLWRHHALVEASENGELDVFVRKC